MRTPRKFPSAIFFSNCTFNRKPPTNHPSSKSTHSKHFYLSTLSSLIPRPSPQLSLPTFHVCVCVRVCAPGIPPISCHLPRNCMPSLSIIACIQIAQLSSYMFFCLQGIECMCQLVGGKRKGEIERERMHFYGGPNDIFAREIWLQELAGAMHMLRGWDDHVEKSTIRHKNKKSIGLGRCCCWWIWSISKTVHSTESSVDSPRSVVVFRVSLVKV